MNRQECCDTDIHSLAHRAPSAVRKPAGLVVEVYPVATYLALEREKCDQTMRVQGGPFIRRKAAKTERREAVPAPGHRAFSRSCFESVHIK